MMCINRLHCFLSLLLLLLLEAWPYLLFHQRKPPLFATSSAALHSTTPPFSLHSLYTPWNSPGSSSTGSSSTGSRSSGSQLPSGSSLLPFRLPSIASVPDRITPDPRSLGTASPVPTSSSSSSSATAASRSRLFSSSTAAPANVRSSSSPPPNPFESFKTPIPPPPQWILSLYPSYSLNQWQKFLSALSSPPPTLLPYFSSFFSSSQDWNRYFISIYENLLHSSSPSLSARSSPSFVTSSFSPEILAAPPSPSFSPFTPEMLARSTSPPSTSSDSSVPNKRVIVIYSVTPRMIRQSLGNLISTALIGLQLSPFDLTSTSSESSSHMSEKLIALQKLKGVYLHSLHVEVVDVPHPFSLLEFLMLLMLSPYVEAAYPETVVTVPKPVRESPPSPSSTSPPSTATRPNSSVSLFTTAPLRPSSASAFYSPPPFISETSAAADTSGTSSAIESLIPIDFEWMVNPPRNSVTPNDSLYQTQWYLRDYHMYSVKAEAAWGLFEQVTRAYIPPSARFLSGPSVASFPSKLHHHHHHHRLYAPRFSGLSTGTEPSAAAALRFLPAGSSSGAATRTPPLPSGSIKATEVVVAVLDTSCDFYHPDLKDNIWFNVAEGDCHDGIDGDGNGYVDDCHGWDFIADAPLSPDSEGHGTASAGLIAAAANNNIGLSGLCWHCKLMCIKTLTTQDSVATSSAHIMMAIDYAIRNGAKISNNSWGSQGVIPELLVAVARARQYGHLFVAAAGNANTNNDDMFRAFFPASHLLDNVLSVGSTSFRGQRAGFSNYGKKSVDLFAPGTALATTEPGSSFTLKSGTSYSAPLVTATAAMVMSLYPHITYMELKPIIMNSVQKVDELQDISRSGGILNSYEAIKSAIDYCSKKGRCNIHSKAAILESWTSMCHQPLLCALPSMDWETFLEWLWKLPSHYVEQISASASEEQPSPGSSR